MQSNSSILQPNFIIEKGDLSYWSKKNLRSENERLGNNIIFIIHNVCLLIVLIGRILCLTKKKLRDSSAYIFFTVSYLFGINCLSLDDVGYVKTKLSCDIWEFISFYFLLAAFNWLLVITSKLYLTSREIQTPGSCDSELDLIVENKPQTVYFRNNYESQLFGWGLPLIATINPLIFRIANDPLASGIVIDTRSCWFNNDINLSADIHTIFKLYGQTFYNNLLLFVVLTGNIVLLYLAIECPYKAYKKNATTPGAREKYKVQKICYTHHVIVVSLVSFSWIFLLISKFIVDFVKTSATYKMYKFFYNAMLLQGTTILLAYIWKIITKLRI